MTRATVAARLPSLLGMSEAEAAAWIGVSAGTFRQMVLDGRMPRPRVIGTRRVWHVDEVRACFDALPVDGEQDTPYRAVTANLNRINADCVKPEPEGPMNRQWKFRKCQTPMSSS